MVNDNELLVKAFFEYFRSFTIDEGRLRARVQCSAEDVVAEQIRWSNITGIPVAQFTKPIVKAPKAGVRKSNSVIVRYSSQSLKQAVDFGRKAVRTTALILPLALISNYQPSCPKEAHGG